MKQIYTVFNAAFVKGCLSGDLCMMKEANIAASFDCHARFPTKGKK